jgi:hypothetical protein
MLPPLPAAHKQMFEPGPGRVSHILPFVEADGGSMGRAWLPVAIRP